MNRNTEHISSLKDERVAFARSLSNSQGRIGSGYCLTLGKEQIEWAYSNHVPTEYVFVSNKQLDHPFVEFLNQQSTKLFAITDGLCQKITGTKFVVPFIGVVKVPESVKLIHNNPDFLVILDGLVDHGNKGTIVRTASAFGINTIGLTRKEDDLFFKKTIDASRGTVFKSLRIQFTSNTQALNECKAQGYFTIATTPHTDTIQSLIQLPNKPIALFVGNETHGLDESIINAADARVKIPMTDSVESLNVSIAAGISMYELKTRMIIAMLQQKISSSHARNLNVTARMIRSVFDKELKKNSDLNAEQVVFLMIIACDATMNFAQIAQDMRLQENEITAFIQPLVEKKYVTFLSGSQNELTLTQVGQEYLAKVWPIHEQTERLVLEGVSETDRQIFEKVIKQIQSNCSDITS